MNFTYQVIKEDILEIKVQLLSFFKNPLQFMKAVPDWSWQRVLTAQILVTFFCGIITGLVNFSIFSLFFLPILSIIVPLVFVFSSALIFYYMFQIFKEEGLSFRKIFTIVFFSNVPFFVLLIVSGYISLFSFIGLAATAILLIVGFVENFKLPVKIVYRLIFILYLLFIIIWLIGRYDTRSIDNSWRPNSKNSGHFAPEVELGK